MNKKNLIKRTSALMLSLTMLATSTISLGHSGRTDSNGGHRDNKNASGLGNYHYHHGMGPHLHSNGVCPYSGSSKTSSKTKATSSSSKSNAGMKAVQTKLNELGYNCGTPDGVAGTKTKNAIKAFQTSKGLKADGIAGAGTKKALGL